MKMPAIVSRVRSAVSLRVGMVGRDRDGASAPIGPGLAIDLSEEEASLRIARRGVALWAMTMVAGGLIVVDANPAEARAPCRASTTTPASGTPPAPASALDDGATSSFVRREQGSSV